MNFYDSYCNFLLIRDNFSKNLLQKKIKLDRAQQLCKTGDICSISFTSYIT